jgi:hypothetical protein
LIVAAPKRAAVPKRTDRMVELGQFLRGNPGQKKPAPALPTRGNPVFPMR